MNPTKRVKNRIARLRSDTLVMLVCVVGVLLLALAAAGGMSWLSVNKARDDLLNQGRLLTERYAAQATLALLYGSPDNARAATDNLLRFPNVVGVSVFNADGSTLLRQGLPDHQPGPAAAPWSVDEGTRVLDDSDAYWLFGAPVFVGTASQDLTVFGEAVPPPQYQGQVAVAISKAALRQVARDIVLSTATMTIITAGLLLPLLLTILRRISNPIQALARVMARTEAGDITVRAQLSGPADVQRMEHAFNSMMDRLQDREQELLDARDAALSAARLKAQFTANVSHEIRTPLNGLLGMLQLLRESPLQPKQLERLAIAEASGNTLLTLINDILDFSRLESGRVEIEHIPFDLPAKAHQIAALFELQTRGKNITVQVDIGAAVPSSVMGDPVRLGQVLTNLVGNAIKFTPVGEVKIQIDAVARSDTDAQLMFRVTDTGIGIASEDLERIFQSFTQADSSTTRQFGGSGLGLTITRQLVEQMGGQMGVESTPGLGSSFWFSLPFDLAQLASEPGLAMALAPLASPLATNARVLVAEDNATNQLVAKGLLEACGCHVDVVSDGQAAAAEWATGKYAAIFMDCNMPGVDGLEATRRIRASEPAGQRVPIIAMTASSDAALLEQCYAAGMDDALPKPMQLAAVRQLLEKWTSSRSVASPPEPSPTADDTPAATAVLNTVLLSELHDAIGDALPMVIRTFISDSARYFEDLRVAIAQRDTARIRDLAHTLKGSASNLGAELLADLVDRVERMATGTDPDIAGLERLSDDFERQHAAAREALAHWSSGQLGGQSAEIPQSNFTVLLVEDDRSTRLALRGILDLEGYRVVEAGDGEEAMQLYPRVRPDLVLLDARLPRQDGFTTCRQMLALPQAQRAPVLMITSLADEISVERAFRAGAADYITKPINFGVLRRRVTRLLQAGASERHAHRLAYHDVLTGLPNRAGFRERLRQLLERAGNHTKLAVVALDLDRFKVLNESLGHDVADEVLVQLGDRIRRQLRADDLLGRVGSDEFALAFEIETADTATTVANKIQSNIAIPLHVRDQELVLSASIGIALYPTDDRDIDGLVRHAETALNQAKSAGGGQHHFWQTHMSVAVRRRLDMETDLRKALERSELMLFYQPQMNLGSGLVTGVEALIRWQHPQRGLVSPADFIPLAEDTGLIGPIGEWVLREACRQNRLWQQHGLPPLRMAVNVSGHQLAAPEFVDTVARALEETDHAAQRLELEITETTLMRDLEASSLVLGRLRSLGVRISIDDFGTGYSSLGYLKHLPVQTVKIDRSFVAELPENAHDAAITNGIIDMGHNLGLEIIGEGVETAAQMRYLRERGCDVIQGYLLHAPTTPGSIETWLSKNQRPNVAGLGIAKGPRGRR